MQQQLKCSDPVILNLWHSVGAISEAPVDTVVATTLLEEHVSFKVATDGSITAWRSHPEFRKDDRGSSSVVSLPAMGAYGYVWTSLGSPPANIFSIPEYYEPDRRRLNAATLGINISAPRMIENALDMAHFPYVHSDVLGAEPHTEVKEYDVEISPERDEIVATRCRFFQPLAAAASQGGADVEYIYRVPHPYCVILYKSSPVDESRLDVIAIFVQPVDQEHIRASMMLCVLDDYSEDKVIRSFQQSIFGQDKPILENQLPKRLPLDPRAETPIRADKSSIAYRRWLSQKGITYGVIPAVT